MEKKSFIVVIFWVVTVLAILIYNQAILFFGKEFLLKVYPLDPRDFLRGDYVSLGYTLKGTPKNIDKVVNYSKHALKTDEGFVVLCRDNDKVARYCGFYRDKPKDTYFLEAKIKYGRIYYPQIQKYFLKEGEGKTLENKLLKGGYARVYIKQNGEARIKGIIAD